MMLLRSITTPSTPAGNGSLRKIWDTDPGENTTPSTNGTASFSITGTRMASERDLVADAVNRSETADCLVSAARCTVADIAVCDRGSSNGRLVAKTMRPDRS